ncbi:Nucleoside transporter FUN26 [Nakaseomyces bracarensis]|uniref:Nucleoside transporter FUN26 n=1 Tax=Nakaseomyces bracarensis TaxID=273131 RepID=A0ABR4NMV9_9SACH
MNHDAIDELENTSLVHKLRNVEYLTFCMIGVGLLWPWNCILSAVLYFRHDMFQDVTTWAKIFASTMMAVSTIASLAFNVWLASRQSSYPQRVVRGLVWQVLAFVVLTLICLIHEVLPMWFSFIFIMILVLMSAVSTALTQNGILAIANVFGSEYSQAVMLGQAVAGVLPSVVLLLLSFGNNHAETGRDQSKLGILFYIMTTAMVCGACIFLFRQTGIGEKFTAIMTEEGIDIDRDDEKVPFGVLFEKLRYLVLSIFLTFVVTLIFPVFASTIKSVGFKIDDSHYMPLIFTLWNLGDLYGRVLADLPYFQDESFTPLKTFVYSALRLLHIPLFLYFVKTQNGHSILLDLGYMLLQFIFGVTNGHTISLSFMKVPHVLKSDVEKEAAGGFTNIFVSVGLACGSLLSYLFVFIISSITHT